MKLELSTPKLQEQLIGIQIADLTTMPQRLQQIPGCFSYSFILRMQQYFFGTFLFGAVSIYFLRYVLSVIL